MRRPPELLKPFAKRLADSVASDSAAEVIRTLRLMGLFSQPACQPFNGARSEAASDAAWSAAPDRVGIWERKLKDGDSYFARRVDMMAEWNYWANVGRIAPKGASRRVVFIGESVARGYFYDPQFTPAMSLEKILSSRLGEGEVEVVDLARTSLEMDGLSALARSALALEPDAVVIFAGNNWGLSFTTNPKMLNTPEVLSGMSTVLRERGVPGLKRYIEERLAGDVKHLVSEVASVYEAKGVPVVWVIPEFNLVDWRDPETNAPHLSDGVNLEWMTHWAKALDGLRGGDVGAASESARRMVELDQGVCVTGLYILAECSQRSGDREAARRYLEMARDALIWDPSRMVSPRAYSVEQEALRREVGKTKGGLVDLPMLFKEYLGGELPGRRLFLDYCHLTSEGIRVAMAAASSCMLRMLNGTDVPWGALAGESAGPSREVEGEAAFLAAIHNAHWWQADELVRYYCAKSVQAAPKIAQVMTNFIDVQTRSAPMLMCKSAERIAAMGSPLIQQYLLRHSRQYLDPLLLDAVVSSLKKVQIDARERLDELRREEHSVTRKDIDLLDLYYCFASRQPQELRWALSSQAATDLDSDYFKAYLTQSRFAFVGEANCAVRLSLTCRLPGPEPTEGVVSLEINGRRAAETTVGNNWKTWKVTIPGELVKGGVNEITVGWPTPEFPSGVALEQAAQDMLNGAFPSLFSAFGEIHRFVASDGGRS
jgi:hypothetical protein